MAQMVNAWDISQKYAHLHERHPNKNIKSKINNKTKETNTIDKCWTVDDLHGHL